MNTQIRTLEGHSTDDLLRVFNLAFSDYLVPLQLTKLQFSTKLKSESIDLSLSVGAFEDEKLVGFILNGMRIVENKPTIYNGGTGVIPSHRGQKLTQKLYQYLIPALKEKNIHNHQLEVLKLNQPAIRSYVNSGFKIVREMNCYKGKPANISLSMTGITFGGLTDSDWNLFEQSWMQQPTWQNMSASLKDTSAFERIGLNLNDKIVAYAIFNPLTGRVFQFCVDPEHRNQGIGSLLFQYLGDKCPNGLSIINVAEADTPTNNFLLRCGLNHFTSLYEMKAVF